MYTFVLFYSPLRPTRFPYIICTVIIQVHCDLPPLRQHCGEAGRGRDSNPRRANYCIKIKIRQEDKFNCAFFTGRRPQLIPQPHHPPPDFSSSHPPPYSTSSSSHPPSSGTLHHQPQFSVSGTSEPFSHPAAPEEDEDGVGRYGGGYQDSVDDDYEDILQSSLYRRGT